MIDGLQNLNIDTKVGATVSKLDPGSIPGFAPKGGSSGWDPLKWRVKYKRINVQNEDDVSELERIETAAIRGDGVYTMSKERFVFMDQILILLQYMERIED